MALPLLFVLVALGAFRLWRFVALDDLPPLVWARDGFEGWVNRHHGLEWSSGVTCPYCSGFWVSCAVVGGVWHYVSLPLPALWFAAVSAVVAALAHYLED